MAEIVLGVLKFSALSAKIRCLERYSLVLKALKLVFYSVKPHVPLFWIGG
jgi:hypothetical protein